MRTLFDKRPPCRLQLSARLPSNSSCCAAEVLVLTTPLRTVDRDGVRRGGGVLCVRASPVLRARMPAIQTPRCRTSCSGGVRRGLRSRPRWRLARWAPRVLGDAPLRSAVDRGRRRRGGLLRRRARLGDWRRTCAIFVRRKRRHGHPLTPPRPVVPRALGRILRRRRLRRSRARRRLRGRDLLQADTARLVRGIRSCGRRPPRAPVPRV